MDGFEIDNFDMKNIIKQFDIDLCTKANKHMFLDFEHLLETKYLKIADIKHEVEIVMSTNQKKRNMIDDLLLELNSLK